MAWVDYRRVAAAMWCNRLGAAQVGKHSLWGLTKQQVGSLINVQNHDGGHLYADCCNILRMSCMLKVKRSIWAAIVIKTLSFQTKKCSNVSHLPKTMFLGVTLICGFKKYTAGQRGFSVKWQCRWHSFNRDITLHINKKDYTILNSIFVYTYCKNIIW